MAATIYDVAALAGVSIKSVSRVLNREPNVSAALQAKVQAAVESLDYRPNLSARTLAGASSYLIAAFVDAELTLEHWRSGRGNDYLSRLEFGALVECRKAGYHLLVELVDYGSSSLEARLVSLLRALRPDGVLLTPPNSDDPLVLDILERAGTPFVRLGGEQDLGRGMRVFMDDRQAAADMTIGDDQALRLAVYRVDRGTAYKNVGNDQSLDPTGIQQLFSARATYAKTYSTISAMVGCWRRGL
ncbi:LacI family DNA-binding transcriptional regulator [Brevundimonas sp.]|uniref:LacI family DNA-binding transcriptional regulator n=1 Tax=Brevundimonas sp. TaxID=1871086 RepID=UPI001AC6CB15|nr:LacI family DNA-binding transcriptional regulator [Brevundimonas sp.]MBN9466943.1 LacI family DNA-binding transcriptional regulator [Brevundimonas sp.]